MSKNRDIVKKTNFMSVIARRHEVTPTYVVQINKGKRAAKSPKAKAVADSLYKLARVVNDIEL